jgi:iron complex transport system substrate-binding protein
MQPQWSRRGFLGVAGAAGLAIAVGRAGAGTATAAPNNGGVTVNHAFGQTVVPAPPKRVVSAGFTEQDDLLAVGVVPIATTEWFGNEPFAVWPWAQSKLGGAQPTVLRIYDGIPVDQIAGLKPDLIIATNAGVDADTYQQLSAIAPTIPQSGPEPFFEPWKDQANSIGQAVFQADKMRSLISGVDGRFGTVAKKYPQFAGKKVFLLSGSTYWQNSVIASIPSWKTDFLTQMGFVIPEDIASYGRGDDRAYIDPDNPAPLDEADVLIWKTESDADIAALLAIPGIANLRATRENRNVFTTKEQAGAIAFSSPLSLPFVADQLPPLLAKALLAKALH